MAEVRTPSHDLGHKHVPSFSVLIPVQPRTHAFAFQNFRIPICAMETGSYKVRKRRGLGNTLKRGDANLISIFQSASHIAHLPIPHFHFQKQHTPQTGILAAFQHRNRYLLICSTHRLDELFFSSCRDFPDFLL